MRWRSVVPRRRAFEDEHGQVSSVRWLGFGWDRFATKGMVFTQWGRRVPLHFYCRYKDKAPVFLFSDKWVKTVTRKGVVAGITYRPLEVGQLWRKVDGSASTERSLQLLR